MKLKEGEVKIYYKHKNGIVEDWDLAIEDALFAFGLKRWASGCNHITGVRDLAFSPETEAEQQEIHG